MLRPRIKNKTCYFSSFLIPKCIILSFCIFFHLYFLPASHHSKQATRSTWCTTGNSIRPLASFRILICIICSSKCDQKTLKKQENRRAYFVPAYLLFYFLLIFVKTPTTVERTKSKIPRSVLWDPVHKTSNNFSQPETTPITGTQKSKLKPTTGINKLAVASINLRLTDTLDNSRPSKDISISHNSQLSS